MGWNIGKYDKVSTMPKGEDVVTCECSRMQKIIPSEKFRTWAVVNLDNAKWELYIKKNIN